MVRPYHTDHATFSLTYGKGDFTNPIAYVNSPHIVGATPRTGFGAGIVNDNNTYYHYPDAANLTKGLRAAFTYQLGPRQLGMVSTT